MVGDEREEDGERDGRKGEMMSGQKSRLSISATGSFSLLLLI
jgi:hypothetical protein